MRRLILNDSPFGWSCIYHIFQKVRMASLFEIIGKDSISLVFFRITFKSIQCPVSPINISLSQILQQIFPWNVSAIVPELPQKERMP